MHMGNFHLLQSCVIFGDSRNVCRDRGHVENLEQACYGGSTTAHCRKVALLDIMLLCHLCHRLKRIFRIFYIGVDINLIVYFRCFSALGDIAKARYMKETFRLAEEISKTKVSPAGWKAEFHFITVCHG